MRSLLAFALIPCLAAAGTRLSVHPQAFDAGGWTLDVQFMDEMGSPCLLAHGAIVPARSTSESDIFADGFALEPLDDEI